LRALRAGRTAQAGRAAGADQGVRHAVGVFVERDHERVEGVRAERDLDPVGVAVLVAVAVEVNLWPLRAD
jgi:hypothetical protein